MALAEARNGRPGPAYLEIPLDVLAKPVDESTALAPAYQAPAAPGPDPKALETVAAMIEGADRPIAIVGSGAHWSGASQALREMAEKVGMPVFSTNAGRGVVPDTHDWSFGPPIPMGGAFGQALAADLVLCLGVRLGFTLMNGQAFRGKTVIRVDLDAGEVQRNRPGDLNIVADARVFCEQLAGGWDTGISEARASWGEQLRTAAKVNRDSLVAMAQTAGGQIHPLAIVNAVNDAAPEDATLVADGGDSMVWATFAYVAHGAGQVMSTGAYLGCLGVGIPFAIAAKVARPESPVFLIQGDGSFGLNAMEFDTAIRHGLPFVCLVANDGAWGMSKHGQGLQYGYDHLVATELGVRPYHEMVKGLGGYGELVKEASEIGPAIKRALDSGLPACINVVVDPTVYSPATQAMLGL